MRQMHDRNKKKHLQEIYKPFTRHLHDIYIRQMINKIIVFLHGIYNWFTTHLQAIYKYTKFFKK